MIEIDLNEHEGEGAPHWLSPEGQKAPKLSVDYSEGKGDTRCKNCKHFQSLPPVGTCEKVRGLINPDYWCKLFEKGEGEWR